MSERLFTALLAIFGLAYLWFGWRLETPIVHDPLGPAAFPTALGGVLVLLCGLITVSHAAKNFTLSSRVKKLVLAVLFYLFSFHFLGFMLATTITAYLVARIVSCSWMEGLLTGLTLAICFYGLFHLLLGVPLPLGTIYRLGG